VGEVGAKCVGVRLKKVGDVRVVLPACAARTVAHSTSRRWNHFDCDYMVPSTAGEHAARNKTALEETATGLRAWRTPCCCRRTRHTSHILCRCSERRRSRSTHAPTRKCQWLCSGQTWCRQQQSRHRRHRTSGKTCRRQSPGGARGRTSCICRRRVTRLAIERDREHMSSKSEG
jgi:hypothetical protein